MEFWILFVLFVLLLMIAVGVIMYLVRMYKQQISELLVGKQELSERYQHIVMENATLKAELTNANELNKLVKEQNEKDALSRQEQMKTEIRLAREQMRSQFEEEMLKRTDALKQANAEQLGQILHRRTAVDRVCNVVGEDDTKIFVHHIRLAVEEHTRTHRTEQQMVVQIFLRVFVVGFHQRF